LFDYAYCFFALLITAVLVDYKTHAGVASKKCRVGEILRRETRLNLFRARDTLAA
jgi:hypothetical protein